MHGIPPIVWLRYFSYVLMGIISYIWAWRLVSRGCKSFLSYVWDISSESPSLDSIPIVHDFSNVFPTNLSGLPFVCDIKLAIDLDPST